MKKPLTPKIIVDKYFQIRLWIGNQGFNIGDACEDAEHAKWMTDMLAKALRNAGMEPKITHGKANGMSPR